MFFASTAYSSGYITIWGDTPITKDKLNELRIAELAKLNALRALHGVTALKMNSTLTAAAQAHSETMLKTHNFAHSSQALQGKYG